MSAIVDNAEGAAAAAEGNEPVADEPVLKSGLLSKRSRNRGMFTVGRVWQERMITLYPSNILYSLPDGTPKDRVAITRSSVVEPTDVDGKSWAFKLTTGDEELILNTISKEERNLWMNAIQMAIDPALDHKRRTMALEANQREMMRIQTEALEAKRKLWRPTTIPFECDKKLNTDSKYSKRYCFIDPEAKEMHWSKSKEHTYHSKGLNVAEQVKEVKQLSENSFSLVLRDDIEQPLFPKGIFTTPVTEVIFWMPQSSLCALCLSHIDYLRKGPASILPPNFGTAAAGTPSPKASGSTK